jgi:hypothetical protein
MEFMLGVVDATLPPGVPPGQQELAGEPAPDTTPALDAMPAWTVNALLPALWRRVVARVAIGPPIRAGTGPPIRAGTGPPIGVRAGPRRPTNQICNACQIYHA